MPNTVKTSYRVALLAGGTSGEREISLLSGEGAQKALQKAGHEVRILDPANREDLLVLLNEDFDVCFICLHGKLGEDGSIQGFLESIGLPYTGSDVLASAIAMDKAKTKIIYRDSNIPTPSSITLYKEIEYSIGDLVSRISLPCVVKPATEGSALGVSIVETIDDCLKAIEEAFEIDTKVIVESFIDGDEYTVAVLGNSEPFALPVIQIIPSNEFYDFEAKYSEGGSKHLCPAPISDELTAMMQSIAIEAHRALGCSGVSRSDVMLDKNGKAWVLETNTIPGMTATSLLPDAARASGMDFSELCDQLIYFALENN